MECKNCELRQRQFYCDRCIRNHLRDIRLQTHHFAKERDDQVSKASRALSTIEGARWTRAGLAGCLKRVEELASGLARLRKDNDAKRERLRQVRERIVTRRRTLSAARLSVSSPLPSSVDTPHPGPTPSPNGNANHIQTQTAKETQDLHALSTALTNARSGLVQELVEVFHVVQVGGRPSMGGRAGTRGEWTINDLVLPVPGDIRRYPPDRINAVITHTIQFLGLLTFYLGVKLPFEVVWSGKRVGVGVPWIGAIKGGESGSWAKWTTKHPLHLTASTLTSSPTASPQTSLPSSPPEDSTIDVDRDVDLDMVASMTTTLVSPPPPQTELQASSSFTTAFAMLLYNVCYLAHTQNVDIPLSQAGDALGNLWAVCCSGELGRRSHETTPVLPPPTPIGFALDFAQVLQATAASPARGRRRVGTPGSGVRVWDTTGEDGPSGVRTPTRRRPERIAEEDGWEVVDEDGSIGFGVA